MTSKLYFPAHNLNKIVSLISTHAFRLSPAKFFAWDMRRVVKRIEQEISFARFAFEVQIFQLLRNFLTAKPIRLLSLATWTFHQDQNFSQKGRLATLSSLREDRPQYILKTRILD